MLILVEQRALVDIEARIVPGPIVGGEVSDLVPTASGVLGPDINLGVQVDVGRNGVGAAATDNMGLDVPLGDVPVFAAIGLRCNSLVNMARLLPFTVALGGRGPFDADLCIARGCLRVLLSALAVLSALGGLSLLDTALAFMAESLAELPLGCRLLIFDKPNASSESNACASSESNAADSLFAELRLDCFTRKSIERMRVESESTFVNW